MPSSDPWAIPWVLETVARLDPTSILDFGAGSGEYGFLARQLLDISQGRLTRPEWRRRIDGVEIFPKYDNPLWHYYYSKFTIGDGCDIIKSPPFNYDLILICDVLEHFERDEALATLEAARAASSSVIVTMPAGRYPQGAVFGNDAETHRSEWNPTDLEKIGAVTVPIFGTFLAVFVDDADRRAALRLWELPCLFHHTGRSLARCASAWFPRMIRSRLGMMP
jgi:hypothetical protein